MRVLTWNLWWTFGPWRDRQNAIRAVLEREQADVLFLQETIPGERQVRELADHLGLHCKDTSTSEFDGEVGRGMANAILSRWPIVDSTRIALPSAPGHPSVRTALLCQLETPWGRWPVATTHLDHAFDASAVRVAQVDVLADLIHNELLQTERRLPAIVGGDFNAVPDSDEIRRLTGRTVDRHDNLVFADVWELCGEGSGFTWDSSNPYLQDANWPNRRIDYLFVSWPREKPAGHPIRTWLAGTEPVDGMMASDHFAVVAELRVPRA